MLSLTCDSPSKKRGTKQGTSISLHIQTLLWIVPSFQAVFLDHLSSNWDTHSLGLQETSSDGLKVINFLILTSIWILS